MSTPLISVVIPTFNRLPMLQEAVASVRQQTLRSWQLIVVDDGSDDGTEDWLASQPDIDTLRHDQPQGPAAARNAGVTLARAPYVAFLDSDDLFQPQKLQLQWERLQAEPQCPLCHSDELWLRRGRELKQKAKHQKKGGWIFEHCLPMCRISPSAAVLRRETLQQLGGFDEALEVAEDYELWLRVTCQHPVVFIPQPLIIKRGGHPGQLSLKYGQIEKFRIAALVKVLQRAPLSPVQREEALATLQEKCRIYALGCEKRGRLQEAITMRQLAQSMAGQG